MIISIKQNRSFLKAYKKGKTVVGDLLVLYFIKNKFSVNRLGVTVSTKIGKACVRNKVKRKIKESFRNSGIVLKEGFDLVIVSRNKAKDASYKEILSCMKFLFKKSNLAENEK